MQEADFERLVAEAETRGQEINFEQVLVAAEARGEQSDFERLLADADARISVATANIAYQREMLIGIMQLGNSDLILRAEALLAKSEQSSQQFVKMRARINLALARGDR